MTTSVKTSKSAIKKLRDELQVPRKIFCRLLPVSERLLADLETDKRIPSETVKREFNELKRLIVGLRGIMDAEDLAEWLDTPNEAFGELKPLEVIERGEVDRIWRMIYYIESGQPA
jgi:hypothetical protein